MEEELKKEELRLNICFSKVLNRENRLCEQMAHVNLMIEGICAIEKPNPDRECQICAQETELVVVNPCGHMGMCRDCANIINNTTKLCPFCRRNISNIINVYLIDHHD